MRRSALPRHAPSGPKGKPGDIVIQVGAWHKWSCPRIGSLMVFDMISARFKDGPVGLAQSNDAVVSADGLKLPEGVKPTRRIVTIDKEPGRSCLVSDGPAPDVRIDPVRPGFASARLWVVDSAPAKIVPETLHLPHTIEPPAGGSVCRVMTFPPDAAWIGKVGSNEVRAFFSARWARPAPQPTRRTLRILTCRERTRSIFVLFSRERLC